MKVAIIEDEIPALEKLERYLLKYNDSIDVRARLSSVEDAVNWLNQNQDTLDLIFMDIQLTDGLSFEIFNKTNINKPVIFTTAFDEYAIDAFKVNSIDYILKPITFTDLSKALKKMDSLKLQLTDYTQTQKVINGISEKRYKDRFMVKWRNHIHSIKTEEIDLFYAEGRTVYLITQDNKKFIIDYKLEELEGMLDSKTFYRVNRTYILNINAIQDVVLFSSTRLKVSLKNAKIDKEIIVSRDKVSVFKEWLEGGN